MRLADGIYSHQPILANIHHLNTPCHLINTFCQLTLSTHPLNSPSQLVLSTHLVPGTDITEVHPDIMYPDTDLQYSHGMGMPLGGGGDGSSSSSSSSSSLTENADSSSSTAQGSRTHRLTSSLLEYFH